MEVNPEFVQSNHFYSQLIDILDYASLRTPGTEHDKEGSSWAVGRFLYLRMRYAWGLWNTQDNKGKKEFVENFEELLEIAGFVKTPAKKAASLLRGYLNRVCTLASVPFTARVEKITSLSTRRAPDGSRPDSYQVVLTKKSAQLGVEASVHQDATEQEKQTQQHELAQQRLQNLAQNMRS
jgi:hypothetical protein